MMYKDVSAVSQGNDRNMYFYEVIKNKLKYFISNITVSSSRRRTERSGIGWILNELFSLL